MVTRREFVKKVPALAGAAVLTSMGIVKPGVAKANGVAISGAEACLFRQYAELLRLVADKLKKSAKLLITSRGVSTYFVVDMLDLLATMLDEAAEQPGGQQ